MTTTNRSSWIERPPSLANMLDSGADPYQYLADVGRWPAGGGDWFIGQLLELEFTDADVLALEIATNRELSEAIVSPGFLDAAVAGRHGDQGRVLARDRQRLVQSLIVWSWRAELAANEALRARIFALAPLEERRRFDRLVVEVSAVDEFEDVRHSANLRNMN